MSIRYLRTLIAVADHGSFTAAAGAVFVTHAAVSQQMKALEADWGVALFDRSRRSRHLTPTGRALVARARDVVAAYDGMASAIDDEIGFHGELVLGAVPTTLTGMVPFALALLKAGHPGLRVRVVPGLSTDLAGQVGRGALDGAILTRMALVPRQHVFTEFAREEMELLASPETESDDPIELLRSNPYIRFSLQAVVGTMIEAWMQDQRIEVSETMEIPNLEVISSMVYANLGVSIVPRQAVAAPNQLPLKRIPLSPAPKARVIGLLRRRDSLKQPVLDALLGCLQAAVRIGRFDQGAIDKGA
ncbi:MAG: LysR family transcriptional regulator [Pseudomonadota bacterium]